MPRIPIRELEEARRDPSEYRTRLTQPQTHTVRRPSYFMALRDAIFRFHRSNRVTGREYLEERLARFKNNRRGQDMIDKYEWYIRQYTDLQWAACSVKPLISIPLPARVPADLQCSGQVARIDVVPDGGYAAWLFRNASTAGWSKELQMPLIQYAVAQSVVHADVSQVRVGVCGFQDETAPIKVYSSKEIKAALREFDQLLGKLGF